MLTALISDHPGRAFAYFLDVPFPETLRRHATKTGTLKYGEAERQLHARVRHGRRCDPPRHRPGLRRPALLLGRLLLRRPHGSTCRCPHVGSPSRCGSRACGSRLPWTAARDDGGSRNPTCGPPAAGARRAASPGSPGTPRNQSGQRRKPQPVDWLVTNPADLAAQDSVLVPQHQKLGILGHLPPGQHRQAAQQAANKQVDHRNDHSAMIPARQPAQA
jgi:hypothetical protein